MNGLGSHFPPGVAWQEHRTPDGRIYYYNSATKVTQWTKPEDLMSHAERALANQPWKEYTAEGGRKYWYNTETKQSSWEMPEAYKKALGDSGTPTSPVTPATPFQPPSGPHQANYGGGGGGYGERSHDHYRDHREPLGEHRQLTFGNNVQAQAFVPATNEPEYATPEEAEAAFVKLLRRSGVQPDWTWEQALRAIVKDPQYRAVKDPKDRKAAFEKYCYDVLIQDKERAKERLTKLRAGFTTMLKSHPEIKHYTRWKTARPIIEGETIFRSTNDEAERRQLFEDYMVNLRKTHREHQTSVRKSAMDGLIELLPKLNLEPYTRWSEAQDVIQTSPPFKNEEKYKSLTKYDILTVFQNHVKSLERTFNDLRQEEKNKKYRKERQARDGFLALLAELRSEGKIKAGTKWSQVYPLIGSDDRYKAMSGQPGSTPMDLFWDVVEEEERALRGPRNDILDVVDDKHFEVTPKTTFQEFQSLLKDDPRTANIERDTVEFIFEKLREKKAKRSDDDKLVERQQRRALDDLRSFMKRLDPPILPHDTYERVKARLSRSDKFQAVLSEEARRGAFEKHVRRLREKEEEADRDRRRRDRGDSYRDRGERSHRGSMRPARSSRSPAEHDPYEADRRKAIAERERNYRKSSMAESLLSDRRSHDSARDRDRDQDRVPRDRERERDRDRDRDHDRRSRRDDELNLYDRERRTREEDRERVYRRRVDRDVSELPYGDERPSSSRRRRADDDEIDRRDSRDAKRLKPDYSRERTPQRDARPKARTPQPAKEKSPGVRAGSEEGEIEED
ncbi:U1 snRNP [Phialemonium atrogriseum]|uniref:U1 snRNP n=1 Tax=Phialemonium atrogriseum TaxID=1093897 RepID=A0AAJ0C404_9PEZI|nr:U1 snRNP [Phialemonium atrogriseum]KAK1769516.1 U1 snRNP [Phialemonium atrogriseum]